MSGMVAEHAGTRAAPPAVRVTSNSFPARVSSTGAEPKATKAATFTIRVGAIWWLRS